MSRLRLTQVPSVTEPDSGQVALFAKTDESLWIKLASGAEKLVMDSAAPGMDGYKVEYFTLNAGNITAKSVTLSETPLNPDRVLLTPRGGTSAFYSLDFTVSGNVVSWSGLDLEALLETGDILQIIYVS